MAVNETEIPEMNLSNGIVDEIVDESIDDENLYMPSISDQLHAGFYRMDRACQTNTTEIVNLKEMANVLSIVMVDMDNAKKSFHHAKLSLQSEYNGRLKEAVLELYKRVNNRIIEIENAHKDHIDVVRRSYRTQLANALVKLSREYHKFYDNKDALAETSQPKTLKELETKEKNQRMNDLAQQDMLEMLRLQEESKLKVPESLSFSTSSSARELAKEVDELKSTVRMYESRIEYLEDAFEETNSDNSRLNNALEEMMDKLSKEEKKNVILNESILSLNKKFESERQKGEEQLRVQKEKFKVEIAQQVKNVRNQMNVEAQKQIDDIKYSEAQKLRAQKLEEEKKLKDVLLKQKEKEKSSKAVASTDVSQLTLIVKKQRAEIARLNKELDHTAKACEMKVKILQEHVHSLKNEMFMRTTLRRQAATIKHAGLTYINNGSVPCGVVPTDNYHLPAIIHAPKTSHADEHCLKTTVEESTTV